jgi:hypothetical protein
VGAAAAGRIGCGWRRGLAGVCVVVVVRVIVAARIK